jgi:hypothetical protein
VDNITLDLVKAERKAINITVKNNLEVFELITAMLNLYIHGFNLIGKLDEKNSDIDWVWLFLTVRSFYSIRCSIELMKKAYYAQAVSLIRMVTESYFLCGNCENDKTITDAVLKNIPNRPDGRTIFNYKKLAMDMGSLAIYENDYMHECNFSHTSSLSLGIMTTKTNSTSRELSPVPDYNEILFIDCCELVFRNGLLMVSFLEKLLNDVSKERLNDWRIEAKPRVKQLQEWLAGLKERYGNQYENR